MNAAYNDRSCYRPCTLDYSLEPDVDPSVCVASLTMTDGSEADAAVNEETLTVKSSDSISEETRNCQQQGAGFIDGLKNETNEDGEEEEDTEDSQQSQQQCPPDFTDQDGNGEVNQQRVLTSSAWVSHHLCFGWRWRTSVLPYSLLFVLWYSGHLFSNSA